MYPTFLPEPVYGWSLDVDTCCETVAWFFEPHWNVEEVADHALRVTQRAACDDESTGRGLPLARYSPNAVSDDSLYGDVSSHPRVCWDALVDLAAALWQLAFGGCDRTHEPQVVRCIRSISPEQEDVGHQ